MDPPVADLSVKDVQDYSDGQLKWIIENGIKPSGMPGWKGILEDEEMWNIVHYIRHLPAKGSLGAPPIFKEEEEEHEHMHGAAAHDHHDAIRPRGAVDGGDAEGHCRRRSAGAARTWRSPFRSSCSG